MICNPIFLLILVTSLFVGCSQPLTLDTGGASETVNASVIVKDSMVTIKTNALDTIESEIFLVKDTYKPQGSDRVRTAAIFSNSDAATFYVDSGSYNIFIIGKDTYRSCSFFLVPVYAGSDDTLIDTFSVSGSVNGTVTIEQDAPIVVYLKGTPFYQDLTKEYNFTFNHIPRGSYEIVAEVLLESINKIGPRSLKREISLEKGEHISNLTLIFSH